jgi:hypothetical protein
MELQNIAYINHHVIYGQFLSLPAALPKAFAITRQKAENAFTIR